MTRESRTLAGILLVILPTVMIGGASLLRFLVTRAPGYMDNPVRQDLFRAGHAHAGVYLVLALVLLRYVDETELSDSWKRFTRVAAPLAAILLPAAFFLSVASPSATEPNALIYLAYVGALILATGVVALGVGLLRSAKRS